VVSVRLALFAEMVKSKPWTTATLNQVGGTDGIGVNFLEETFSSQRANPSHRLHAVAARGVLQALLPGLDTDIKGGMRSQAELLEASGYQDRPADFADLLRILDGELRLITPTAPEGRDSQSKSDLQSQYYQLTHDYLVPSLRDWLTRKQKETRKGRAELKLAERSVIWTAKRENKQLPSALEWLQIRWHSDRRKWTEPQRTMMQKAAKLHGITWGGTLAALLAVGLTVQYWVSQRDWNNKRDQTRIAVESLQNNLGPSIPVNIGELKKLPESLALGDAEIAADMCQYEDRPDPGQRTIFIHEFPQWEWHLPNRTIDLSQLAESVAESKASGLRSGISLAVGSIPVGQTQELNPTALRSWSELASRWVTEHSDTSTHSAAKWLLRRWQRPQPMVPDQAQVRADRDWFVNSAGMTMLRIRPPALEPQPEVTLDDPLESFSRRSCRIRTTTLKNRRIGMEWTLRLARQPIILLSRLVGTTRRCTAIGSVARKANCRPTEKPGKRRRAAMAMKNTINGSLYRAKPAIACYGNRNGNSLRAGEVPRIGRADQMSSCWLIAARCTHPNFLRRWDVSFRMHGACRTCTVTCGNGAMILEAPTACSVAAVGSSSRRLAGRRTATRALRRAVARTAACAWP